MRRATLFIGLLTLPLSAIAQSTCPVTVDKVNPKVTQGWNRVGRSLMTGTKKDGDAERNHLINTPDFSLELKNASGKDIRGLEVQAAYFDATEDLHFIPIAWNASQIIKNGETKTLRWPNELYNGKDGGVETSIGWIVVAQKILFEDGSTWEYTSSTGSCYGEFWADKKHPRLTKLPSQEKFQQPDQTKPNATQSGTGQ